MLTIQNTTLTIALAAGLVHTNLPAVAVDSTVHAWAVPTDYRADGVFVSVQTPGQPQEVPACDFAACTYLGAVDYPASQELQRVQALAVAHARVEAWRDQQEALPIVFAHADREWDGGLVTRQRLQPVIALAELPPGFFWTDHANEDVPVSLAELGALNAAHEAALVLRGFEIHAAQRAMKSALQTLELPQLQAFEPEHHGLQ